MCQYARRKLLFGAINNRIICMCHRMNVNGQNFHVSLFAMRWEGIPTFTPVNKTHSNERCFGVPFSVDDKLVFDYLNESYSVVF